jgi:hypothetical protein
MYIMRKIFTLLLLLAGFVVSAQTTSWPYNNEWIQFNQTYYKIKIARDGVYRIPKSLLDANGMGNADVQNFELWRNGEKVPFYPSVSGGVLPSNGYLEFWGEKNDGKADKPLYRNPAYQHTDKNSFQTDTAVYFLSVNNDRSGFRVIDVFNNVGGNSLPVEQYFMHTEGVYYTNTINSGFYHPVGVPVYSSSYDRGEFFASGDITPAGPLTTPISSLNVFSSGPASTLKFGAVGNINNQRTINVRVNGNVVKDTVMDYFNDLVTTAPVDNSIISSGSATVQFFNGSSVSNDKMQVSFFELTYPRVFDFSAQTNFKFVLPARSAGYFLQITYSGAQPVLYDLTNGQRFVGDLSSPGKVQFALPGTANERRLVLVSADPSNINTVTQVTPRRFTRYTDASVQGDYIIISHSLLHTGSSGNDPVVDYKNYRQSVANGKYKKVMIADIDELVDQFAFGIKKHPLSVRNFIRYARKNFSETPKYVFLIGRGMTYVDYQRNRNPAAYPLADVLNLVPTFGSPGSDNLLSSDDLTIPVATTPIGRLSVVSGKEIEDYLQKIKEYELIQKNAPNTVEGRQWMKNVVHVTGSSDQYLGTVLCNYMNVYKQIIEDTMFGGRVSMFCKTSTNPVEQLSSDRLSDLFAQGISFLTYFGHSSATTLEFNIDNPDSYNNQGKYPIFFVNGCYAGNFFTYYEKRFTSNETLSEKFVLAKQRGSIAFVASTHYGLVNYLNLYLTYLYNSIGSGNSDKTLGETFRDAVQQMLNATGTYDYFSRLHGEEMTIHGDPAILINAQPRPDYVIEAPLIKLNPAFISLAENSYTLSVKAVNLGKAVSDSITLEIKQQYPDGSTGIVYRQKIPGIRLADSLQIDVPIVATRDKGQNKIIATIDADFNVSEASESNNTASKEFYIYEEEARPAFPYNYAIINNPTQKLYASTANPLSTSRSYIMEMDTTERFNSANKITQTVTSPGGVLEFNSNLTYKDSMVYYWRVSPIPASGDKYQWANSSFTYMPNSDGYNQSHYFQQLGSSYERIFVDTVSRTWKYGVRNNNIYAKNCIYNAGRENTCTLSSDFVVSINGQDKMVSACVANSLIFNVLDSVTLTPWLNVDANGNNLYRYGSGPANCGVGLSRKYNFEFSYMTPASRKLMMDFMDALPSGVFVVVRSVDSHPVQGIAPTWMADTASYGSNNSLYHKLLGAGFVGIDSVNSPKAWIFIYQKGNGSGYIPQYRVGKDHLNKLSLSADITTPDTLGFIRSPKFGPAKKWKTLQWNGNSLESPSYDNPTVDVIGVDYNNVETTLYTLDKNTLSLDVSSVDAVQYPYLVLKMRNIDSVNLTPFQLKYWRIFYDPVPEGAIAPNLFLVSKDTLELGEKLQFGVAFKNVSYTNFDSLLVKVNILDQNNVTHVISLPKYKPIISGDTIKVFFELDSKKFQGTNVLNVDINPDNNQPETYHFNNFLFKNFYVRPDNINPLLDVTFDGVHILNRDIVSAKPRIEIKLKDESKYMLLNDTLLSSVQIKYPDGTLRTYNFDGDTLRFIPATSGSNNTAVIEFTPQFTKQIDPQGDEYELIVKGKDKSGNKAGEIAYRVAFRVITKPMISNLLNYPNPFSTSTAFVFTVTGSDLPQNIRIQILTVTGKIVREITMNELGPIHIGRNITDFKWDGTDQYGQKLANGVYLYRVITSMNGKPMDKYKAQGDDTDKYFNNGYGKMYLMR